MRESIRAAALATMLLLTVVSPLAGSAAAAPSGFVGVPSENVSEDLPSDYSGEINADDLRGDVMASEHASSMDVVVTTPDRASTYLDSGSVVSGSGVAIVLRDVEHDVGREVALPAAPIRDAFGTVPESVRGTHDDGSSWSSQTSIEDGYVTFDVPHFSTNTVTFSGTVEISSSSATDGSKFAYNVSDLDSGSDPVVNLTGQETAETDTISKTLTSGTINADIAGDRTPPNTTLTIEGNGFGTRTDSKSFAGKADGHSSSITVDGSLSDRSVADGATVTVTGDERTDQISTSDSITGSGSLSATPHGTESVPLTLSITPTSPVSGSETTNMGETFANGGEGTRTTTDTVFTAPFDGTYTLDISTDYYDIGMDASGSIDYETYDSSTSSWSGYTNIGQNNPTDVQLDKNDKIRVKVSVSSPYSGASGQIGGVEPTVSWSRNSGEISGSFAGESISPEVTVGDTWTTTKTVSPDAAHSADLSSTDSLPVDVSLSGTERTHTVDPAVTVGGTTKSHSGTLGPGETATFTYGPESLSAGGSATGVSLSLGDAPSGSPPMRADYTVEWQERDGTLNPSVDVDQDGSAEVSHNGILSDGQTASGLISPSLSDDLWDVSTTGSAVTVSADVTERTITTDPAIELNGVTKSYDGTLADGETTSLTFDSADLKQGENRVNVSVGDGSLSADAPSPVVGFNYSHSASQSIYTDYTSGKWVESYNVTKEFASDQESTSLSIPFTADVAEIEDVEMRTNGGSWSSMSSSNYALDGTDLTVSLGTVSAGEEISVRTTGYRVVAHNGAIEVVETTVPGDDLDSKIEVVEKSEGFAIETTGTTQDIHYAANPSWTANDYSVVKSSGYHALRLPDANVGSTTRVRTLPMTISPDGETEIEILKQETPRFVIRPGSTAGSDRVEITYRDVVSEEKFALVSETQDSDVTTDSSGSDGVVSFATTGTEQTYVIEQRDQSGGAVVVGSNDGSGGASPVQILSVLGGAGAAMIGFVVLGRRLGLRTARSNIGLAIVGSAVGTIGVGIATGRSIISDLIFALTELGYAFGSSTGGTIVVAIAILGLVYLIDSRIIGLPRISYAVVSIPLLLWVLDALTGGGFAAAFSEVGTLAWIIILVGSIALLWRFFQPTIVRIGGGR